MAAITYLKPNGEWGIEGVDLSALPPKVYGALCKLHDLEHRDDVAIEYLAKLCGIRQDRLMAFIEAEQDLSHKGKGGPDFSWTSGEGGAAR